MKQTKQKHNKNDTWKQKYNRKAKQANRECWLIAYSLFLTLAHCFIREITVCHTLKAKRTNISITEHNITTHKHNKT